MTYEDILKLRPVHEQPRITVNRLYSRTKTKAVTRLNAGVILLLILSRDYYMRP